MVDVFRKGKFELLALTQTKLKGNREILWCGEKGIFTGVQDMEITTEGLAVLMNDVWCIAVINFRCVSLMIKFRFSRVKVCVVLGKVEERNNGTRLLKSPCCTE